MIDDFIAPACDAEIEILYQDDDILLINKPSGLLSLSGKNPLNLDSVHYRLVNGRLNGKSGVSAAFSEAKLPHRLDFGTSGIMVVGLHAEASKSLNKQFQERAVQKRYIAMLEGWVVDDSGEIEAPIAKDKVNFPLVKTCEETGKPATTQYIVLERLDNPKRTKVEFTPLTGRTHQLRIHSHLIGNPILGCDLYKSETSQQKAERLMLHAKDLYFKHPVCMNEIHGEAPFSF